MVNSNLLKSYMTLNSISQRELAKSLNISLSTLNNKIKNKSTFTIGEAVKICSILNIEDDKTKVQIFLS